MSRVNIVQLVEGWVEEIISDSELELVEVEYVKEASGWVLRVFLDKPAGVDLEDCRGVSEILDKKLDEEDPIPGAYSLEAGRAASIRTYSGLHGRKRFTGILRGLREENVLLDWEGEIIEIPLELIAKANLAMEL